MQKKTILLSLSFFSMTCFTTCQNTVLPFIDAITTNNLKEVKLGESNYYLKTPASFEISEARGKEGQLGYNIIPKDTASTMFGFIEIKPGHPIGGGIIDEEGAKGYAISLLLNEKTTWKISQIAETGYFNRYTGKRNISATVSAKNKNEIDSLIAIIATLVKK